MKVDDLLLHLECEHCDYEPTINDSLLIRNTVNGEFITLKTDGQLTGNTIACICRQLKVACPYDYEDDLHVLEEYLSKQETGK